MKSPFSVLHLYDAQIMELYSPTNRMFSKKKVEFSFMVIASILLNAV